MKPLLTRKIALFLVLLLSAPCFGWGRDGHRIIGEVAASRLTPEARAGVEALLGGQTLVDVGAWADEIRSDPAYRWASPLHYANVQPGAVAGHLRRKGNATRRAKTRLGNLSLMGERP